MIKVLIADDHPIVRRGLKQILVEQRDMTVGGEARNAKEALDLADNGNWNVMVLDLNMPDMNGLDVLKQVKKKYPKSPVLILSVNPEEQYAVRALKAGASGYLTKESAPEELVKAIRKAVSGGKYVTSSLAERLALNLNDDDEKPLHETLSNRELQVMLGIASGKTVKTIAEGMFLSVKTISTYRTRILEKMQMKTNAELTHYAVKNGLV